MNSYLNPPPFPGQSASPMLSQPGVQDLAGRQPGVPPWYRMAFFPTAPFYSTNPQVGYATRFYSGGVINADVGQEAISTVIFDLPCRIIAINGSAFSTAAGNALPVGVGPRDCFLFRAQYANGERIHTESRIASSVVGTSERPGELGGAGWTINQGASIQLIITPLIANLRIDITLHCLEMRGDANFSR